MNQSNEVAGATIAAAAVAVGIDIESFDAVNDSQQGHEFELKQVDGYTGTGVHITVLGKHADAIVKWNSKLLHTMNREAQMAQRKGKAPEPKSLEELHEQNIDGAIVRAVGWRNVKQPFTADALRKALRRNPHWIDQIVRESEDVANFTKKPLSNSLPSPQQSSD